MLYSAWESGNLPLYSITIDEYRQIQAFSSGVERARKIMSGNNRPSDGDNVIVYGGNPEKILPGKVRR